MTDSIPFAVGPAFVGSTFPRGDRSRLSYYGFDDAGTIWRVDTNPSCVGTVSTQIDGEAALVILDSDARKDGRGPVSITVATAFSATDGDPLWGPTEVPGPSPGAGLIFANTPKALTAARTPTTLLDAASGTVVDEPAGTALYEHRGTALEGSADSFSAIDTRSGRTLWTTAQLNPGPHAADTQIEARFDGSYGPSTGGLVVLEWTAPGGTAVAVIHDLRTGAALGKVDGTPSGMATVDESTQTVLLTSRRTDDTYTITAARPREGILWRMESAGAALVSATGAGMVYARANGTAVRLELESGAVLASGDYALPVAVLPDGTALFPTDQPDRYAVAVTHGIPATG